MYRARCSPKFTQISIHGAVRNCSRGGSLQVRHRWCAFCVDPELMFSGSPSPSHPFHTNLAVVQALYRARCSPEFTQISIHGAMRNSSAGSICRSVPVGALIAPTQGLHFQAFHHLSFHFISTLHWCKHCTGVDVAPNLRKFPFTAKCVNAEVVICMSVTVGAHFAPTKGLHFQALQLLDFNFIYTLHWRKHCTGLDVAPNLRKILFTALCAIPTQGVVCRSVLVGALFAPTQG